MEYAAGGELFVKICSAGRFSEDEVQTTSSLFSLLQMKPRKKKTKTWEIIFLKNRLGFSSNSLYLESAIVIPW